MARNLDSLAPEFKPLAIELIARLVEDGIAVLIVSTRRTPTEQAELIRRGLSWTQNSRHLTGHAIDLAPYEVWQLHGPDKLQWNADDPVWARMGEIGERLGLRWGGRWRQRDLGHFELAITRV